MIIKSLLISLFLLFPRESNKSVIKIEGLAAKYHPNQSIEFTIINNDNSGHEYWIGMEFYDNNKWLEMISDITRPESKATRIYTIKPRQKVKNRVPLKTVFYLRDFPAKKFRLKIVYGESVGKMSKICFSDSFE